MNQFKSFLSQSLLLLGVCAVAFSAVHAQGAEKDAKPAPHVVYVKAGHLFDATSDNLRDNVVIVVEDERIKSVIAAGDAKILPVQR